VQMTTYCGRFAQGRFDHPRLKAHERHCAQLMGPQQPARSRPKLLLRPCCRNQNRELQSQHCLGQHDTRRHSGTHRCVQCGQSVQDRLHSLRAQGEQCAQALPVDVALNMKSPPKLPCRCLHSESLYGSTVSGSGLHSDSNTMAHQRLHCRYDIGMEIKERLRIRGVSGYSQAAPVGAGCRAARRTAAFSDALLFAAFCSIIAIRFAAACWDLLLTFRTGRSPSWRLRRILFGRAAAIEGGSYR